jgi:NitT/TauT family transport system permease protein
VRVRGIWNAVRSNSSTIAVVIGLFALWQAAVSLFAIPEFVLPSPLSALAHLFVRQPDAYYNWKLQIGTTLSEVLVSFAVTAAAGVALAVMISWSNGLRDLVMPFFLFVNSLPIVAVAPIILLWFGYGLATNILIAFLVSFSPVVINTATGLSDIDEDLIDLVRTLHASKGQIFVKIRLPNSLPYIFSGLKICATMVVVGAIVGEFVASDRGLGYIIVNSQFTMDTPPIFAALIVVSVLGVALFAAVALVERIAMPWYEGNGDRL